MGSMVYSELDHLKDMESFDGIIPVKDVLLRFLQRQKEKEKMMQEWLAKYHTLKEENEDTCEIEEESHNSKPQQLASIYKRTL